MKSKQTPYFVTFQVPEPGDPRWGKNAQKIFEYVLDAALNGYPVSFTELAITTSKQSITNGQVLDVEGAGCVRVQGDVGPITLNAAEPIKAPLNTDGKHLTIVGTSDTNPVTIPDGGNVDISGKVTLYRNEVITLMWVQETATWIEISRNT